MQPAPRRCGLRTLGSSSQGQWSQVRRVCARVCMRACISVPCPRQCESQHLGFFREPGGIWAETTGPLYCSSGRKQKSLHSLSIVIILQIIITMRPTFCIRGFAYIHYAVQFPLHPLVFTAPGFRGPFVYSGILFRKASCSSLCPSIMFFFMPKIRDQFLDGRKKLYFILVESWKFYLTNST